MSESPEHQDDELPESFETKVIAQIKILIDLKIVKQLCYLNVSILCLMSWETC